MAGSARRVVAGVCVVGLLGMGVARGQEPGAPAGAMAGQGTPRAAAGATQQATVTYTFERPGLAVPRFKIVVREDGTGTYDGEQVATSESQDATSRSTAAAVPVSREMQLTPATTSKIFKAARAEKFFQVACASKAKNIADTGAKQLSYSGPDGSGACAYNYSENKDVSMLTDLFLAISATLEEGRRLEFKRRYDHLGLDAELDVLLKANDSGRAVELVTIAPVLQQLAGDTETMERVRLRAAKLLDRAANGR